MGQSKIPAPTKDRGVFYAASKAYDTYALALEAMETAYDSLTDIEKIHAYILMSGHIILKNIDTTYKVFNCLWLNSTTQVGLYSLTLKNHTFTDSIITTSVQTTDKSSTLQTNKLELRTITAD